MAKAALAFFISSYVWQRTSHETGGGLRYCHMRSRFYCLAWLLLQQLHKQMPVLVTSLQEVRDMLFAHVTQKHDDSSSRLALTGD